MSGSSISVSGSSISLICKNRASDLLIGGAASLSLVVELGESILRAADEAAHIFSVQVMRRRDDAEFAVGRGFVSKNIYHYFLLWLSVIILIEKA